MAKRTWLLALSLLWPSTAGASLETTAQTLTQALSGILQACPDTYASAVCLRVEGRLLPTAARVDQLRPEVVPGQWRDGPEDGLTGDVPSEQAVLHLVPRGEAQVLLVLQPTGSISPAPVVPVPFGEFTITNPQNSYVVLLDNLNRQVRDVRTLTAGTYTMITSRYGFASRTQSLQVGAGGLRQLTVPILTAVQPIPTAGGLNLPVIANYLFVVQTSGGQPVTDISALPPGDYDVFSYKDGEAGPLASFQRVEAGKLTALTFNFSFSSGASPSSVPVQSPPMATPMPTYTAPSSGQCWVNGYTRSNGTRVSGYYRRC